MQERRPTRVFISAIHGYLLALCIAAGGLCDLPRSMGQPCDASGASKASSSPSTRFQLVVPGFSAGRAWTAGSYYRSPRNVLALTSIDSHASVESNNGERRRLKREKRKHAASKATSSASEAVAKFVAAPVSLLAWNLPCEIGLPSDRIVSEQQIGISSDGGLDLSRGWVRFPNASERVVKGIQAFQQFTLVADLTSKDCSQSGPARILTCSADANQRNFTLGQDSDKFVFRIRTSRHDLNGTQHDVLFGKVRPGHRQNVSVQYDEGALTCSVDGSVVAHHKVEVDFCSWQRFPVTAGNEVTGDRPWTGHIHRLLMSPSVSCCLDAVD